MHHPIPVRGRTDLSLLRLVDEETPVGTGPVSLRGQFLVQRPQLVFEVEMKRCHGGPEALSLAGLLGGPEQVLETDELVPQAAVPLHPLPPLSQPPTSLPISSMALAAKP
jgi:hypothetical protein